MWGGTMRKRISAGVLILILVGCLFFLQPTKQSQVEKKEVTEPSIIKEVKKKVSKKVKA